MPVEPVRDSVGDVRGFVQNTLSRKRASFLRQEKRRQRGKG